MRFMTRIAVLAGVAVLLLSTGASAQIHGLGQVRGTVKDDTGSPLKGVHVRATMTGANGVKEEMSDDNGSWQVNGMSKGEWHLTFQIAAYVPLGAKVMVEAELARIPPISVVLKKVSRS